MRKYAPYFVSADDLAFHRVARHSIYLVLGGLHLMLVVNERQPSSLGQHDVEIDLAGQSFVKAQRKVVERRAFWKHVVGTHIGGIASGVAAAEPPLLQHGAFLHSVLLCEIVPGCQSLTPAPNYDPTVRDF